MKKEEILSMEAGRELDILVAKEVFGIETEWDYPPGDINHVLPKLPFCKGEPRTCLGPMAHAVGNTIYEYSIDVSAAWPVVEKMESLGYGHKHLKYSQNRHEGIDWMFMQPGHGIFEARGKKAPEAICKAALLAKYSLKNTKRGVRPSKEE